MGHNSLSLCLYLSVSRRVPTTYTQRQKKNRAYMTPYSPAARIQPRYILACTTRYAASPMRKYGTFKPRDANRFGVAVHVKQTKSWTGADALFFSLCFLFFSSSPLRTTNVRSLLHFTLYGLLFDPVRSRYIPRVHSPRQRRPYER